MSLNINYGFLLLALFEGVWAETAQSYWTVPDGQLADFKQTFKNQQTLPVAWNGWNSVWTGEYLDNLTIADLWVTSFNYDQYQYSQLLHESIDVSQAGTYTWVININSTVLEGTAEYVLRFKPPLKTYNVSSGSLSSPGFIILPAASSTTTTSSTTSIASTTSTDSSTTSSTSSTSPTATPTSTESAGNSGLSSGAKAGIGIGCAVGGIAVILFAFFFRRWKRKQSPSPEEEFSMSQMPEESIYTLQQSDYTQQKNASELEGANKVSKPNFSGQVAELPVRQY